MSSDSREIDRETGPDVWNYLCYRILTRLDEEQEDWRNVTSGQFSKLPCIADRHLKEECDIDIQFPRYWYQFGEVGNRYPIDSRLYIVEEKTWGKAIRPVRTSVEFDIASPIRVAIDEIVDRLVDRFADTEIEVIKSYQYDEFAPNGFIRGFESLRQDIYDLAEIVETDPQSIDEQQVREDLHKQLENLVVDYDDDLYESMRGDFLRWEDTMHVLISNDDFWSLEAHFEEFWSVFSKVHLRMEHNNNPIDDQLESWRAENEERLTNYRDELGELRSGVLDPQEEPDVLEPIKASYSESVWDMIDG